MSLSKPPSVVQLPGGVRLNGIPFKIVAYHDDGTPKLFEICPQGGTGHCRLYADEQWIRSSVPENKR